MFDKLLITDLEVKGKKVLMRVDFNVPLDVERRITDDTRIVAALPSINYVLDHGGSVILMSHLGRPKGKKQPEFSLAPCATQLSHLIGHEVKMAPNCVGSEVDTLAGELKPGEVMLLENLRFHLAEEHPEQDPLFAKQLAQLGDCFVSDAFATAHRSHSSTVMVPTLFPGKAAAGFLMAQELKFLGDTFLDPKRPFHAIIGGAKVSSKIGVINALCEKVDTLFIGGGMAYTFFKAQGFDIGDSIHEDKFLETARDILRNYQSAGVKLYLPVDHVVADHISEDAQVLQLDTFQNVPAGFQGVDIGQKTIEIYSKALQNASTIFWNGPLGVFECPPFAKGTESIARTVAKLSAVSVVGGGDSVAAIKAARLEDSITHISTGGGACLEFIEKGTLPGIEVLSSKNTVLRH